MAKVLILKTLKFFIKRRADVKGLKMNRIKGAEGKSIFGQLKDGRKSNAFYPFSLLYLFENVKA